MSLILDALNRSRSETDDIPSLETRHPLVEPERSLVRRFGPWFALVVALLVIGWLLWDRPQSTSPVVPVAEVAATSDAAGNELSAETALAKDVQRQKAAVIKQPPPAAAAPNKKPQREKALTSKPDVRKAVPAKTNKEAAARGAQQSAEVAKLYAAGKAAPQVSSKAQKDAKTAQAPNKKKRVDPVKVEQILEKAQSEAKNAKLVEHPALFIASLSQSKKDAIPTLFYERHDYSSNVRQSRVVINGKTLRVGGKAANGVKVEEILKDSVVLSHQGTSFRLRALNSWINL